MKKNIFYAFIMSMTLLLVGCGSNDISDPSSGNTGIDSNITTPTVPTVDGDYGFYNYPSSVTITQASTEYPIKIQVINSDVKVVSGKDVYIEPFDKDYGSLKEFSVATGSDGYAIFYYTSPSTLAGMDGQKLVLKAFVEDDNNTKVDTANITLSFVDTTNYTLTAVPSDINISTADTSRVLDLYLEDTVAKAPVADQVITAQFVDPNNGTLSQYTATTDATGHVAFNYTRPDSFTVGDTFDITFEVAGGTVPKQATVGVTFVDVTTAPPVDTTNYTLTAVPSDINISTADTSRVLDLYLEDTVAKAPVADQVITAQFVDPNNGTLSQYTATTDATGHVAFNYTRPDSFTVGDTFDITFEVAGGTVPKQATVGVTFVDVTTAPPVDTTNYTLTAVPSDINISTADTSRVLDLYLENTVAKTPVADQVITAQFVDPNNGTLSQYTATTDATGHVAFNYTRPDSFTVGDTFDITFEVAGGTVPKQATVGVTFVTATYVITPDQNITVTDLGTAYNLNVSLTKQENGGIIQPAAGEKIIAEFLMPVNGTLAQYEATVNSAGVATFVYTSPARTLPTSDVNVTFYYNEDHAVTGKTLLVFDPQVINTVAEMYVSPDSFTITSPNEVKDITIVTVNAQNVGISTNVQLEQPFFNSLDYGQFDMTNVTTNSSGYAIVTYTGPADLTGLVDRNITVTELSQNISKKLNIKFNTVSQSDTYEIVGIVPGSFAVDSIDSFGIQINNITTGLVIDDTDVHEVNLTSNFSNMLLFSNGTDTTSYMNLGENNTISIESQTLSGVAIIEVSAAIFDGKNDVVITASIPVTIISGPVTALSIPYVGSGLCTSDKTGQLYSNKHLVHAVDKYNNPAQVRITPTLINEAKIIVPDPNYGVGTGNIDNGTNFSDSTLNIFNNISSSDRLIITPNISYSDYSYIGNWTIDEVVDNNNLILAEQFSGTPVVTGLSYIIGDEDRLIGRDNTVAHVVDPSGNYMTDANGTLLLEVCFDPKLAAHTFTLGAYAEDNSRTGIATIEAFRWNDYTSEIAEVDNNTSTHNIYLGLGIGGSVLEPLIDVDISPSSFIIETKPHCSIDYALSDFHTNDRGNVRIVLNTDGNTSVTGGVDTCTVEWDAKSGSISYEY